MYFAVGEATWLVGLMAAVRLFMGGSSRGPPKIGPDRIVHNVMPITQRKSMGSHSESEKRRKETGLRLLPAVFSDVQASCRMSRYIS
jgi:hypothetical protein